MQEETNPALYKLWAEGLAAREFLSLEVLGESLLHRCGRISWLLSR